MTSASVLIVLLVGTVVGALLGLLVGGSIGAWYHALKPRKQLIACDAS